MAADAGDERFGFAGFLAGFFDLGGVGAGGIDEAERIGGADVGIPLFEAAVVQQQGDALARAEAEVVVAFGADVEVVLDLAGVEGLAAGGAFLPQAVELRLVEPLVVDGNGLEFIAPVEESAHEGFRSGWPQNERRVAVREEMRLRAAATGRRREPVEDTSGTGNRQKARDDRAEMGNGK